MNARAARGQTAMTFALTNGCNAIVDILDKHQAILDAEEAFVLLKPRRGPRGPLIFVQGIKHMPVDFQCCFSMSIKGLLVAIISQSHSLGRPSESRRGVKAVTRIQRPGGLVSLTLGPFQSPMPRILLEPSGFGTDRPAECFTCCFPWSPRASEDDWTETLQLPKPEWACKHEKPERLEPYAGRRICAEAKPDRPCKHSLTERKREREREREKTRARAGDRERERDRGMEGGREGEGGGRRRGGRAKSYGSAPARHSNVYVGNLPDRR